MVNTTTAIHRRILHPSCSMETLVAAIPYSPQIFGALTWVFIGFLVTMGARFTGKNSN
jgi:hypothetical protein